MRPEAKNVFAGKDQQQFNWPTDFQSVENVSGFAGSQH
jgi:hypothetical protein